MADIKYEETKHDDGTGEPVIVRVDFSFVMPDRDHGARDEQIASVRDHLITEYGGGDFRTNVHDDLQSVQGHFIPGA